jgi:hypothetical protein
MVNGQDLQSNRFMKPEGMNYQFPRTCVFNQVGSQFGA